MKDAIKRLPAGDRPAANAERERQASFQFLTRQCDPDEVAACVSFSSPASWYVTGTILPVDGGQSGRLNTGEAALI